MPSDIEIQEILRCIKDEQRDLLRCREEIDRIQGALFYMKKQELALQNQILERRSLLSSKRRVPNELWAKIFEMCASEQSFYTNTFMLQLGQSPILS
ncbi:hypothetical protein V5O48_019714, partial [Marasmius crinis-equi]